MRSGLLLGVAAILSGILAYNFWRGASEKAAAEREAQWSQSFSPAYAAYEQKRYADSETMVTTLLSQNANPKPSQMINALMLLGSVTLLQHRNAEAETYVRKAITLRRQDPTTQEVDLATSLCRLGEALRDQGKYTEAIQAFHEAFGIYQESPDVYRKDFAWCVLNLGILASGEHKLDDAERYLTESTAAFEKYLGPNSADTALAVFRLGRTPLQAREICGRRGRLPEGFVHPGSPSRIRKRGFG